MQCNIIQCEALLTLSLFTAPTSNLLEHSDDSQPPPLQPLPATWAPPTIAQLTTEQENPEPSITSDVRPIAPTTRPVSFSKLSDIDSTLAEMMAEMDSLGISDMPIDEIDDSVIDPDFLN
eukprot:c5214_g1_i3.p2 GENE.c5214_g1_i3~~c5214_g1_i3.p2  ORF type:complete len:120 (+),score=39.26 c5214_g1_i3:18-377(+)